MPESDIKMLEGFFKPQGKLFEAYDHLARWDCMEFGRQILAGSPAAKKA